MIDKFYSIQKHVQGEIEEKKSKFITYVFYVQSKEEVDKLITEIRKEHPKANHHVYAYRILTTNTIEEKCSDDGEPAKTSGPPILEVLIKNNMLNVLVIVVRYFGGILLGTGGLTRAYTKATTDTLKKAEIIQYEPGIILKVQVNYTNFNKLQHYCQTKRIYSKRCNI